MRKILPLVILLSFGFMHLAYSQDFSNKGKDFWLCFPGHIDGNNAKLVLYITSNNSTTGTVTYNGGSINFAVSANGTTTVSTIPTAAVINAQREGVNSNYGIHITSLNDIVVYTAIFKTGSSPVTNLGTSVLLPTNTLGKEYYVSSFQSKTFQGIQEIDNRSQVGSEFCVVAVEDNTTIRITATAPDIDNVRLPVGTSYDVNLKKGDVYQYRTVYTEDITGTNIRSIATGASSCKPIAVFSASTWTSMDCTGSNSGDNLLVQSMPKNTWGKKYIAVPFEGRQYDIIRIIVSEPNTVVKKNGVTLSPATLQGNSTFYEFKATAPTLIDADKPVMAVQYMVSQNCDTRNNTNPDNYPGDPEMVILSPLEQTINDITVVSARKNLDPTFTTTIDKHFITIIVKTNATTSVLIDGSTPSKAFTPIGTTGYSYVAEDVTGSTNTNASHRIKSDSGFIALAHGLGSTCSYGYNAGANVRDLYQFLTIQNDSIRVNQSITCDNTPFSLYITLPYNAPENLISVDWGSSLSNFSATPKQDSTYVKDTRTLYRYKLISTKSINTPGIYPIKIYAQNPTADGCSGQQEMDYEIEVLERPTANFTLSTAGCGSSTYTFLDSSIVPGNRKIKDYVWNFGDSKFGADSARVTHTYTITQAFPTHQVVTDIGCVSEIEQKELKIGQPPTAKFELVSGSCSRSPSYFVDSSNGNGQQIVKWFWNFGDGKTDTVRNPVHIYDTSGNYTVTLMIETVDGCKSAVATRSVTIFGTPRAAFSYNTPLCSRTISFQNNSTGADTYIWTFGSIGTSSQVSPTQTFPNAGLYSVQLIAQLGFGCPDTSIQTVKVNEGPKMNFDLNFQDGVCVGEEIIAKDRTVTGAGDRVVSWTWSDDGQGVGISSVDSIMKVRYSYPGKYRITLYIRTLNGCVDSLSKYVDVNNTPTVKIIVEDTVCINTAVKYSNGVYNVGNIFDWTLYDGTKIISSAFNYAYSIPGKYLTTLQVTTATGCKSKLDTAYVTVLPAPVASFTVSPICEGDGKAVFTNTTIVIPGIKYLWEFGDGTGSTSTSRDTTYTYSPAWPGGYVKLTTSTTYGCTDDTTIMISPIPRPTASLIVDYITVCLGNPFDMRSMRNTGITSWYVSYGDGTDTTVSSLAAGNYLPSKKFKNPGTYTIKLFVKNSNGCNSLADSTIVTVPPTERALISIGNKKACVGQAIRLSDTSNIYDNYAAYWDYGNGIKDTSFTKNGAVFPIYTTPGIYYPTLQLLLNNGCYSTLARDTVTILGTPGASFVAGLACSNSPVQFTNTSTGATSYLWNFGDGLTDTARNPLHPFATNGPWNVTLSAVNAAGCKKDTVVPIIPLPQPVSHVRAIPTSLCVGAPMSFKDSSSISAGAIKTWTINYGDGTDSTVSTLNGGMLPTKVYNTSGTFKVKITVTSAAGCVSKTDSTYITITPTFSSSFAISKKAGCKGDLFMFTDNTTYSQGTITKWYWNYGDGTIDSVSKGNASHTYAAAGTYVATLQLQADGVCKSYIARDSIIIEPNPILSFNADTVCVGEAVTFKNTTTGATSYNWSFGDNSTSVSLNPTHPYTVPGVKAVKLVAYSSQGCKDSTTKNIAVNGAPTSLFNITSTGQCASDTVRIVDASTVATAGSITKVEVYWDISSTSPSEYTVDLSPSTGKAYTHTYPGFTTPASKTFRIKYKVYSGKSCVDSTFKDITLYAAPIVSFLPISEVCDNAPSFMLGVSVAGGIAGTGVYTGTGVSSAGVFSPLVAGAGTHNIIYAYTSVNGCTGRVTQAIVVNPTPIANAGPDKTLLDGGSVILAPTLITGIPVTYVWSPPTYLDDTTKPNAVVNGLTANTIYTLRVTSDKGCFSTDAVLVKYAPGITIPNIFSPNGDGIHDYWDIEALRDYPDVLVQIFNRYGQLVYRSEGYSRPWDGRINGRPAPMGTYYYIIDLRNGKKPLTGYVDIIR